MSNIYKATKLMAAIDKAIADDQGGAFRQNLQKVLPHMDDAYRGADEGFRSHMGASLIGGECSRAIWYNFRWTTKPRFDGRMLRLFNRGHLEEARFIASLLTVGVTVWQQDEHGKQFRISDCGGHFGGSGDGVGMGIPDLPTMDTPALLEFKTHNDKSFTKLVKEGVRVSKYEHFVQMQTYGRKMGLSYALYGATNKNNDDYYFEIVPIDPSIGDQYIDRARQLIMMRSEPAKLSNSPGWFACSWCDHKPVCHLKAEPERNCRTCQWSIPDVEDGRWYCIEPGSDAAFGDRVELNKATQLIGCESYLSITARPAK